MRIRPTKIDQDAVSTRAGTAYSVPSVARGHCGLSPDRASSGERHIQRHDPPKASARSVIFLLHGGQHFIQRDTGETGGIVGHPVRDEQVIVVEQRTTRIDNVWHVPFPFA